MLAVLLLFSFAARSSPPHRVLLLNSYHQGYAWTDDIVRGALEALRAKASPVNIDIEYRDYRRHEDSSADYTFALYLQSKFAHDHFDVIVASDDRAVQFLLNHRKQLFTDVPVIFCGVNEYHGSSAYVSAEPASRPWLAGVLEQIDLDKTVELALRLRPGTRSIVTVGDEMDDHYDRDLARLYPDLSVRRIPVQQLTLEEIGAEVSALPADSILLLSAFSRDRTKRFLSMDESVKFVCDRSPVPVFGLSKSVLGWGIVGGKLNDGYAQGRMAGEMAASVLQGASPKALGIRWKNPSPYEFDWLQLVRWGIPVSMLPPGSIIVNRPKSFYALHPVWVWGGLIFILCQSAAIILLLIQQRRRLKAERALATHARQLARSNYMLEQFAQVTAHDFQEPIRTVAVCTELLGRSVRGKLDADSEQVLGYALNGAQRMHAMVRGLVDWVRAVDNSDGHGGATDAKGILNQALESRRSIIQETNAEVVVGPLPAVQMEASHLQRIWEHLLDNALRYRRSERPRIEISADRGNSGWKFAIQDNGVGVPAVAYERIFGVFKRLNRTDGPGLGMGLAISRRIVQHYGGRIWVESQPGEGSKFFFTIPDADSRPAPGKVK